MVEVLIAVLILGIGLLGVAALQATALRNSQSAMERSQGVVHAYTILDAMRANVAAARAGDYNMGMTCAPPGGVTLAIKDRQQWIRTLKANLGQSACGSVNCQADACTVSVQWDDSRGSGGSNLQTFTTVTRI